MFRNRLLGGLIVFREQRVLKRTVTIEYYFLRFPDMCVANITRDSVRDALTRGITAEQVSLLIISHLLSELSFFFPPMTEIDLYVCGIF